jgi:hypothetical protein
MKYRKPPYSSVPLCKQESLERAFGRTYREFWCPSICPYLSTCPERGTQTFPVREEAGKP